MLSGPPNIVIRLPYVLVWTSLIRETELRCIRVSIQWGLFQDWVTEILSTLSIEEEYRVPNI